MSTKEDEQGNKGRFNRLNLISFDLTDFIYIYIFYPRRKQELATSEENLSKSSTGQERRERKKKKKKSLGQQVGIRFYLL